MVYNTSIKTENVKQSPTETSRNTRMKVGEKVKTQTGFIGIITRTWTSYPPEGSPFQSVKYCEVTHDCGGFTKTPIHKVSRV